MLRKKKSFINSGPGNTNFNKNSLIRTDVVNSLITTDAVNSLIRTDVVNSLVRTLTKMKRLWLACC